uniref:Secreted protein n=1 Tax=Photinus pyralis TaxID=7054 RepID=A0A1Y1KAF5_PHOPY
MLKEALIVLFCVAVRVNGHSYGLGSCPVMSPMSDFNMNGVSEAKFLPLLSRLLPPDAWRLVRNPKDVDGKHVHHLQLHQATRTVRVQPGASEPTLHLGVNAPKARIQISGAPNSTRQRDSVEDESKIHSESTRKGKFHDLHDRLQYVRRSVYVSRFGHRSPRFRNDPFANSHSGSDVHR